MTVALVANIARPISSAISTAFSADSYGALSSYGLLGASANPDAVIEALFASDEQGAWYDPSDLSTMFQDSAGTTPVTAVDQPVGKILDKSGNSNHAVMATAQYRPQLVGTPVTYGSELLPALGAGWTAGAGWTNLGVATAASGSLSVSVSLDVGSIYEFSWTVQCTAGGAWPRLSGGTNSDGIVAYASKTITQFLRAESGSTTFSIVGNTFTGSAASLSLRKILSWKAPYGLYGQINTRLVTSANINATLPCFISSLFLSHDEDNGRSILGVGDSTVSQISLNQGSAPERILSYLRSSLRGTAQGVCRIGDFAAPSASFVSGMFVTGNQDLQINEIAKVTIANTWQGGDSLPNMPISIGSPDTNGLAPGIFYGGIVRFASTSDVERRDIYKWTVRQSGLKIAVSVGDSMMTTYPSPNRYTPPVSLIPGCVNTNLAESGHTIANQKTVWNATNHDNEDVVIVCCGLNNLNTTVSASNVVAELQDLINTIRASTQAKVYVATLTPNRAYLISYWGATDGPIVYQKWLDVNAAIAGSGPTPITNVYGYIDAHTANMNDGSGNLAAQYNHGDGIHSNLAGKQVMAAAFTAKLVADGVLS